MRCATLTGPLMVGNRKSTRDLALDQSAVDGWHGVQATKRAEGSSATHRKKVAAEAVCNQRTLQFERARNRPSLVWLPRGLNASRRRNVARSIGSAGARRGTHRPHRIGGWLKDATRSRLLTKSINATAGSVGHCAGGTSSRNVSSPGSLSTKQTSCRTE